MANRIFFLWEGLPTDLLFQIILKVNKSSRTSESILLRPEVFF